MTWMDHSRGDCSSVSFRDDVIYPEVISSLKYKQLWRGLEESHKKASVVTLLAKCKEILGEPAVAESDNCFDNCPISFNMASNLVYIGSNDKDALQAAVAKLHTLVELHVSGPLTPLRTTALIHCRTTPENVHTRFSPTLKARNNLPTNGFHIWACSVRHTWLPMQLLPRITQTSLAPLLCGQSDL